MWLMRHANLPGLPPGCRAGLISILPLFLFAVVLLQPGCGGGNSASIQPPPPPPSDFAISVTPASVSLAQGTTSQPLIVSISGMNGFSGNVQVSLGGVPAGVSTNPAGPFSVETGGSRPVVLGVSAATAIGTFALNVQGSSGNLSHGAALGLTVQPGVQLTPPLRTGFVRIDSTPISDSSVGEPAHRRIVYDAVRNRIFVANRLMNRVDVFSTDQELIARIPVAEPTSIDFSADGTKIWVGSAVEQAVSIDPMDLQAAAVTVTGIVTPLTRFSLPQEIVPLSNGTILVNLRQAGTQNSKLARWNPASNSFTELTSAGLGAPGPMARSGDHTKMLVAANNSTGGLFLYEAQSNSFTRTAQFSGSLPTLVAANGDGSRFAVCLVSGSSAQVGLMDGTLAPLMFRSATTVWGLVFSIDGRFLYISENTGDPAVVTILDARTGQFIGQVPDVQLNGARSQIQDTDETARIFGISNRGVSFLDAASPHQFGPPYATFTGAPVAMPAEGNSTGGTATVLSGQNFVPGTQVFFGGQAASGVSVTSPAQIAVTTPPVSKTGAVNVSAFSPNGWMAFAPEAFSYGPQVVRLLTNMGTPRGGSTVEVIGYGFGSVPSQLSVLVGGQAAVVTSIADTAATLRALGLPADYPFPIELLTIQTPPGTVGAADLAISSASGTTSVPGAFQYLKDAQVFSHAGLYRFILYDQRRQRVYLSNIDHVDVFDLNAGRFLAPLNPPGGAPPCPGGPPPNAELRGLALTPDGSRLVVADFGAQMVYLMDPDVPGTGVCVSVGGVPGFLNSGPARVAATSVGNVFVAMAAETSGGCSQCLGVLDPVAKKIQLPPQPEVSQLTGTPIVQSANGGRSVFLVFGGAPGGPVAVWEAATDHFQNELGNSSASDLAVADDGNIFVTGKNQTNGLPAPKMWGQDLHLAARGLYQEVERLPAMTGVPGETMHPSGGLLYQPFLAAQPGVATTRGGVDIFDVRRGTVRKRVFFSEALKTERDALHGSFLTVDETGKRIFALTESGLSILELGAAPISIGSVQPRSVAVAGGAALTIRGSGFQSGTKVSINGNQIASTFVDANTLRVTTPLLTAGPKRITVTNPDGDNATFDAAFTAN